MHRVTFTFINDTKKTVCLDGIVPLYVLLSIDLSLDGLPIAGALGSCTQQFPCNRIKKSVESPCFSGHCFSIKCTKKRQCVPQ